jgi:hypothetical protein
MASGSHWIWFWAMSFVLVFPGPQRVGHAAMFLLWKRSGERTQVRFMPGCLLVSVAASVVLTVLINLVIRLF